MGELEAELRDFLAPSLAKIKMPKLFDFRPQLPREANGKLLPPVIAVACGC